MNKDRDKLAGRLACVISRLNNGDCLDIALLAEEFGVDLRTIQRDIKRLSFLPIEKKSGKISLASYALGSVSFDNLREFLKFCGIDDLFPNLDNKALQDLFNPSLNTSLLICPAKFEKTQTRDFEELQVAILNHKILHFSYKQKDRVVKPYKLTHYLGRWYLLGIEEENIKTFALDTIRNLSFCGQESFIPDSAFLEEIEKNQFVFLSKNKNEIVLFIDSYAMPYFEKRRILPNQMILYRGDDGMEVRTKSSYDEEILRIVQEWMPHIMVVSPQSLKIQLAKRIKSYLKDIEN